MNGWILLVSVCMHASLRACMRKYMCDLGIIVAYNISLVICRLWVLVALRRDARVMMALPFGALVGSNPRPIDCYVNKTQRLTINGWHSKLLFNP